MKWVELLIVFLIVGGGLAFVIFRIVKTVRKKSTGCGCSSSDCGVKTCSLYNKMNDRKQ